MASLAISKNYTLTHYIQKIHLVSISSCTRTAALTHMDIIGMKKNAQSTCPRLCPYTVCAPENTSLSLSPCTLQCCKAETT